MKIKKFTIFGERCSGTNYVQQLILKNFDTEITWEYGWKHFFGFNEDSLENSDDTLFICVVREPYEWLNSLYKRLHHLYLQKHIGFSLMKNNEKKINIFLNKEIWSVHDEKDKNGKNIEMMNDRNIYTGERYKNIFELRHIKLHYLIEDLPKKVKHCILIKYEDLLNDFENTMERIKNTGIKIKEDIKFPENHLFYKKSSTIDQKEVDKKRKYYLKKNDVFNNSNLIVEYEKKLGYL